MEGSFPRATNSPARGLSKPSKCGWGVVVVIAVHLSLALTIGLQQCFGVFYLSWKNEFETSAKETAAVQSIIASVYGFSGLLGGVLTKHFGCRFSGMLGGALSWAGFLCTYWANSIFHVYVTVAVAGAGLGIIYNSGLSAVVVHFKKKYKTANSIAIAGPGTGIMVVTPLLQNLLDNYGWRGAILIASAISAHTIACGAFYRPSPRLGSSVLERSKLSSGRAPDEEFVDVSGEQDVDLKAEHGSGIPKHGNWHTSETSCKLAHEPVVFKTEHYVGVSVSEDDTDGNPQRKLSRRTTVNLLERMSSALGVDVLIKSYRLLLLCLIQFELHISYLGFVLFVIPRAQSINMAPSSAAFLLTALGVGSLFGRLGHGLLISWKISPENVTGICLALSGASILVANVNNWACLAIAAFIQGFESGALFGIAAVLTRRFVGSGNFAVGSGWLSSSNGVGLLIGPILAGWLLDATDSFTTIFYVLASIYFVAALQVALFPVLKRFELKIDTNHHT